MTTALKSRLFVQFLVNVGGILLVLEAHFCESPYKSLIVLHYTEPAIF
jgi:hypothetical protein